jgi:hypothetical protein
MKSAILRMGMLAGALLAYASSSVAQQPITGALGTPNETPPRCPEPDRLKQVAQPNDSWQFQLSLPGWLVGISGNIGPHNAASHVYIGPDTVIKNLDMGASLSAEARKGRFGIYGDFFYLSDSDGIGGIGRNGLLSKVDIRGDQTIADLEANTRILQGPRGWLEVRAGVRYMNLYNRVILHPNKIGIQRVSALLAIAPSELVPNGLNQLLQREESVLPIPPPTQEQKADLLNSILEAKQDPALAAALRSGNPSQIAAALARVQKNIARILTRKLDQTVSMSENWFDPYVGLAARYNLGRAFYLTAKGDIGGFGAGSKLTSQDYAALGCQISRNVFAEIGYRYLFVNYQQNGAVFDAVEQGAQFTLGLNF